MYDVHRMYVDLIKNLRKKNISERKVQECRRDFSNWIKSNLLSKDQLVKYRVQSFFDIDSNIEKWQEYYSDKPEDCPASEWPIFRVKDQIDKGDYGRTLLHSAVIDSDLDLVKELISDGIDVNEIDNGGNTAFELAVLEGRDDIVDYLLGTGLV